MCIIMVQCGQTEWISICQNAGDWSLLDGGRLDRIVEKIDKPETKYPYLLLFVGKTEKNRTLAGLFPDTYRPRQRGAGVVNLYIDPKTAFETDPIFFAEADIEAKIRQDGSTKNCQEEHKYQVDWPLEDKAKDGRRISDVIYTHLLFPFVDVLCIFADDLGGVDRTIARLDAWSRMAHRSDPRCPSVILITTEEISTEQFFNDLPDLSKLFTGVKLLRLSKADSLCNVQVRDAVLREALASGRAKEAENLRFSARHICALFRKACIHISQSIAEPFDLLQAAREEMPLDKQFKAHVASFIQLCHSFNIPFDDTLTYIASAILMNGYPPEMHNFHPRLMFQKFYREPCQSAFASQHHAQTGDAKHWCTLLESKVASMFSEISLNDVPFKEAHIKCLKQLGKTISPLKLNTTCVFCLCGKPEHSLECGHAMCNYCVSSFGSPNPGVEYSYQLSACPLCGTIGALVANLMPPTAGSRVLSVDGGGIRGIVSLSIIKVLEEIRELPFPIQDEFDFAIGTSAGGLVVLQKFSRRLNTDACISMFLRLAKEVFVRPRSSLSLHSQFRAVCALFKENRYDINVLESCLKDAFGGSQKLFGTAQGIHSGAKVAVTATTASKGELCILSNYNGVIKRGECGYKHVRPTDPQKEVLLWEAAQITAAAPSLFPPKFIEGTGLLQDGGVGRHNNPIDPAIWESRACLDAEPDLVISIGSGYTKPPSSPTSIPSNLRLRSLWPVRIFQSLWHNWSAENKHLDYSNQLTKDDRGRYFRLNPPLTQEPRLDDVAKMTQLRVETEAYCRKNAHIFLALKYALCSVSFFFELSSAPKYHEGVYKCHGYIRCRSRNQPAIIQTLTQGFGQPIFKTSQNITLASLDIEDVCSRCGVYSKEISYSVGHLDQKFAILLHLNKLYHWKISGFPNTIAWFVERQKLKNMFGRADHLNAKVHFARTCDCPMVKVSRRKRHSYYIRDPPPSKRRCFD